MPKQSAGVLAYRLTSTGLEVLLVHPGGPYWQSRDDGVWSLPKGEYAEDEQPEAAARREFTEETGWVLKGQLTSLGTVRQAGGKIVTGFAIEAGFDVATLSSNAFEMEWPPRSGRMQAFPEVDRAAWFPLPVAETSINPAQRPFLARVAAMTAGRVDPPAARE